MCEKGTPSRKTIYLANPYGFSASAHRHLLPKLILALEDLGLEVWEPFERNDQVDFSKEGWRQHFYTSITDIADLERPLAVFAREETK